MLYEVYEHCFYEAKPGAEGMLNNSNFGFLALALALVWDLAPGLDLILAVGLAPCLDLALALDLGLALALRIPSPSWEKSCERCEQRWKRSAAHTKIAQA